MKSYNKRHEVAHFMPIIRADAKGKSFAAQPFFNWNYFTNDKGKSLLDVKQIKERKVSFDYLCQRVIQHKQHIEAMRGLPVEYFAQIGDLVHPPLDSSGLSLEEPEPQPPTSPA